MILAIETSCDDTCVALMEEGEGRLIDHQVGPCQSQHQKFGGVVPEIAGRGHMETLPELAAKIMSTNAVSFDELSAVAVTYTPGLIGSLLIGVSFAKAIAWSQNIPLIPVDHLEGHLFSPFLDHPSVEFPFLGLIVSGGHTHLLIARALGDYELLGKTTDDALGEAYDKVAKLLGFVYPGGKIIDTLAEEASNPERINLPVPLKNKPTLNFSYSGLKTAVRNLASKKGLLAKESKALISLSEFQELPSDIYTEDIRNVAGAFQKVAAETLRMRITQAAQLTEIDRLLLSGGVASNKGIRRMLSEIQEKNGLEIFYPQPKFCTDNAAMIAYIASRYLMAEKCEEPNNLNIEPSARSPLNHLPPTYEVIH